MNSTEDKINTGCNLPLTEYEKILLAHGSGGKLTSELIEKYFYPRLNNQFLQQQHDGAVFTLNGVRLAFSCDSYVVQPVFFPGGNIGDLAVNGTVNDLCMCGAKPVFLSAGFILEEGFSLSSLDEILKSMRAAADNSGIQIITGDTKVVERGKGDGIYINTAGIGIVPDAINISPRNCKPGDSVIINGGIAEHGISIIAARNNLDLRTSLKSDTASLKDLINNILSKFPDIHMMRDPTRGGLSSALNEIARAASVGIEIDESSVPLKDEVRGICELLGFDPLYIANEGKVLLFVDEKNAADVLSLMREHPLGKESQIIGKTVEAHPGMVTLKTVIGTGRIIDMISGEQLPRIC